MELVVDANILVAGFLRAATTRELLLDERLTLWAPEYALLETQRILFTPRIQRKFGKLSPEQVRLVLATTTASIQVLPEAAPIGHTCLKPRNWPPILRMLRTLPLRCI